MSGTTLAIISDIHYGPDQGTKRGSRGLELFDAFQSWVSAAKPDRVVDLGDRITSVGRAEDRALLAEVVRRFRSVDVPTRHLLGNIDVKTMNREEHEEILGRTLRSSSEDLAGFHLVYWQANPALDPERGLNLPVDDLRWLEDDLGKTNLPAIVFTHIPLANGSMRGNYYFEKLFPHHAHYSDAQADEVQSVLEQSSAVLCINGHAHWNAYHCIDGIHYVTLPSLTETFLTPPEPTGGWALLTLSDTMVLEVMGRAPMTYRMPARARAAHWINAHKPYASKPPV